jgi:hypothetical protein
MFPKLFRRGLIAMSGALVSAVVAPGCADSESMLFIRQVMFRASPDCSVRAEPDGLAVLTGVLDISFRTEYNATILVGNQLVARGSTDLLRTETSKVSLNSAEVIVQLADETPLNSFTVPVAGFVDEAQGTQPGYGVVALPIIDAKAISQLKTLRQQTLNDGKPARVVSRVKVSGRTLGGNTIESGEFQFVTNVCYGCLISFPSEADDPSTPEVDCNLTGTSSTSTSAASIPCVAGQDGVVDCRTCNKTNPACQTPGGGL